MRAPVLSKRCVAGMDPSEDIFEAAFEQSVEIGNRLATKENAGDTWDVADGMLAGAIQFWLFSRQPCGDPRCTDCDEINTADARMVQLRKLVEQFALDSEYYHAPTDVNVGRA